MQELLDILSMDSGARFRRTDLHVHTPASADMHVKWRNATPTDVVDLAIRNEVEVIAVTDHNSVEWCDPVREAAGGKPLYVFPGVEITTSEGHLLAIFDTNKPSSELREFLVQVGIRKADFGRLDAISVPNMTDLAAKVDAEGGIAIAAHVDREAGFRRMVRSGVRKKHIYACRHIRAMEIVDSGQRDDFLHGRIDGYPRAVACVQGSDCWPPSADGHHLDAIGHRHCYLKMDEISIFGLRQAVVDPDVRIRFMTDPAPSPAPVIEGLWVSGGFMSGQKFRLSDNITCLIGGTGSGKSLTLELVRFALDQQVDQAVLPFIAGEAKELLHFALGELNTVYVLVRKGSNRYLVERVWTASGSLPPKVSRVVGEVTEAIEEPIHLPRFFPIKGYSQGEIIEYAREPLARLSLIDTLIDIADDRAEVDEAKSSLRRNATELVELRRQLHQAEERIKDLPGLTEEISTLSRFFDHPRVKEQESWYRERSILDRAAGSMREVEDGVAHSFPKLPAPLAEEGATAGETPNPDLMQQVKGIGAEIEKALQASQRKLTGNLDGLKERLVGIRGVWDKRFEQADREYKRLLAALDKEGRGLLVLHEKLSQLRDAEQRLKRIKSEIENEILPRSKRLQEERDELLNTLQAARRAITTKRREKAAELTDRLQRRVIVNIHSAADSRQFEVKLRELRVGSRVADSDIAVMAQKLHPVPFVKSLLGRDFRAPAELTEVREELFGRLLEVIEERNRLDELFELQLVDVEDGVGVQFAVGAETYRDLEGLAHGQKCSVVLMISLAEGDFPLVVDQPEDALHAPWIEDYIVPSLRNLRGSRQCIFATRSANVLVSADAEQVIALTADANQGQIERTGALDRFDTLDLILYHVEGGREAFKRRQEKYGLEQGS
jgi:hypothetical protein